MSMSCCNVEDHPGYRLTWLASVLRAAGLKVVEQPAWETRGHGDIGEIEGILCHDTVSPAGSNAPDLGTVTHGRPDLAGPLAQLLLARDGTFYVIAAGKCYHAGAGNWHGVTAGNEHLIGIEAENNGVNEPWPENQLEAYAKGCAAILAHIHKPAEMCAGHREYALPKGRKIDPDINMDAFRARVSKYMAPPSPAAAPIAHPAPVAAQAAPQVKTPPQPVLAASVKAPPNGLLSWVIARTTQPQTKG